MRVFASLATTVCLAALLSPAQPRAQVSPAVAAVSDGVRGDWRRHEIVRTYRDDEGCLIVVIAFHHADGGVDSREQRDCRKF